MHWHWSGVSFDGSAHHDRQIGGAGAGLFEISSHGLQLLDWGCLALPSCKDNIVAEVMGADLALHLYERYVHLCHQHQVSPKLLDGIQGDIKPLINHLQFQGRLRRLDLISILDRFHQKRSRIAPLSAAEYRPREANFVADYLAGQGSAYLLSLKQEQTQLPLEPVCLDVAPPYELLLKNHAVIAGFHAGGKFVLTLQVSQGHGPEEDVLEDAGEEEQPLEDDETINRDTDEDHDEPAGRKEQPLEDDETINRDTDEDHDEPAGRKEQPLEDDETINRDTDEDHDEPAGRKEQPLEDDETINRDTDEDHDEPAGRKEQPLEDDETINRDTDEDHDEPLEDEAALNWWQLWQFWIE